MMSRIASKPSSVVNFYGQDAGIDSPASEFLLVHYPHDAQALATTGDWDVPSAAPRSFAAVTR